MMLDRFWKKKKRRASEEWNYNTMFGPHVNFAVGEAYKLLRTNIMFSLADEGQCHILGVTSSVQGEGKSTTCCNIGYALSEAGKRVLLLEADLRRPTIASKLGLERTPGLTNLLVTRDSYQDLIQFCTDAPGMDVLVAGNVPPNPSELLGSKRMEGLMEELAQDYDYIVVDLPPVTAVSDAIAVSKLLDGVVMVVRGGVAEQKLLSEAMRQLQLVNVRILGFVYRDSEEKNGIYASKYSKKYYKYYRNHSDETSSSGKSGDGKIKVSR